MRVCVLIRVSRESASAVTIKYSSVAPQRATRDGGDGGLGVDRLVGCSPAWDLGACTVEQSGYCILNENNDNSVRITKSCSVAWLL